MLKKCAVPLNKNDQYIWLLWPLVLFIISGITIILLLKAYADTPLWVYSHSLSRRLQLNSQFPYIYIGLLLGLIAFSIRKIYTNTVYYFQLHTDVLIIVHRKLLHKKIQFIDLQEIQHISIKKELCSFPSTEQALYDYELTHLTITLKDSQVQFRLSTDYYALKALKNTFKDFLLPS